MGSTPSGPFSAAAAFTGDSVTPTLKEGDDPNESDVMVDEWRDRDAKLNDCTCKQVVTYHSTTISGMRNKVHAKIQ